MSRDNIIALDRSGQSGGQIKSVGKASAIIDSCRQAMSRGLKLLCEGYFEKLDDTLYKLADKATSNDLQTSYFDTLRDVRKEREGIENIFQDHVAAGYESFWRPGSRTSKLPKSIIDIDYDNLALIESDILEEELAISNMVSRGENLCMRELYALEQRFSRLLDGMPVESKNNPLAPSKICAAFRASIDVLDVDIPIKIVIYKVFEQEVVSHLDEVYAGINELLRDAGVLPKLRPKIRYSKVAATTSGRYQGEEGSGRGGMVGESRGYLSDEDEETAIELFDTLRQLLSTVPQGQAGTTTTSPDQLRAETSQVIDALSALQYGDSVSKAFDLGAGNQGYADLKNNLLQQVRLIANNQSIGAVNQIDHDTIDMISLLFEFILEDTKVPDAMKVLLAQLQIPVIKVAILDKDFFSKRSHPARRLLNGLAHAVVGWSDDKDRSENSLYGKVESIVRRVLSDFDKDIQLFADLAEELDSFLRREESGSEAAEKRVSQIASGKEQLGMAQRRVKTEIDKRLKATKDMPRAVVNLLNEGWKDVLILHFLRYGAKSEKWQGALDVMDRLIGTIKPKQDPKEQDNMLREIPIVLEIIRREMSGIQCDQHLMTRLFKDMEKVHLSCMQGKDVPEQLLAKPEDLKKIVQPDQDEAARDMRRDISKESLKYMKLAEDIPLGSWLELKEKGGVKSRVKLLWRSGINDNCLFVNRKGVKVKEMKLDELALALRVGTATVITGADDPLMDRAFKAMIESLKGPGNPKPVPA